MPRAKSTRYSSNGPTPADLEAFKSAMEGLLQTTGLPALPPDLWAQITQEAVKRGYTITVSPSLGGRAYRIGVPLGTRRIDIYLADTDNAEVLLRSLLLAVGKLPVRE